MENATVQPNATPEEITVQRKNYEKSLPNSNVTPNWTMLNRFNSMKIHNKFIVDLTTDEITSASYDMRRLYLLLSHTPGISSIDLPNNLITVNGKPRRLTKYLSSNPEHLSDLFPNLNSLEAKIAEIGKLISAKKTLLISTNPAYILGMSVIKNGRQLDTSCHWPGSSHNYKTGPASYLSDGYTVVFAVLSPSNHLTGRQICHVYRENGDIQAIATCRKYGNITDADSRYCREKLYAELQLNGFKKASENRVNFNYNGFKGYIDDDYFKVYRTSSDIVPSFTFGPPVCVECGSEHYDKSNLSCCTSNEETFICHHCNEEFPEDEGTWHGDYFYCDDCFSENYFLCDFCGEYHPRNDQAETRSRYFICEHCIDRRGYAYCEYCETYHDDYVLIEGTAYCTDHVPAGYSQCEKCGEWTDDVRSVVAYGNDRYLCSDCLANYVQCEKCGEYFTVCDITDSNIDNITVCNSCLLTDYPNNCSYCETYLPAHLHTCNSQCATANLFSRQPFFSIGG